LRQSPISKFPKYGMKWCDWIPWALRPHALCPLGYVYRAYVKEWEILESDGSTASSNDSNIES
jgi:hypothetical protein